MCRTGLVADGAFCVEQVDLDSLFGEEEAEEEARGAGANDDDLIYFVRLVGLGIKTNLVERHAQLLIIRHSHGYSCSYACGAVGVVRGCVGRGGPKFGETEPWHLRQLPLTGAVGIIFSKCSSVS